MNQIDTLFGDGHDQFLASLRKAVRRRERRAQVKKAIRWATTLVRIKKKEIALLHRLQRRLRQYDQDLGEGIDPEAARHILGLDKT